jgi:hypothetical protein
MRGAALSSTSCTIRWSEIMRNVTITLDDSTAEWARVFAARHQTSVSHMLGKLLAAKMGRRKAIMRPWKATWRRPHLR